MFIFSHIPKTAGTALIELLKDNGLKCANYEKGEIANSLKASPLLELINEGKIDVVAGHIGYGIHKDIGLNSAEYITTLRDPVERCGSFYDFVCQYPGHTLQEQVLACGSIERMMYDLKFPQLDNCMVRMYCGEMNGGDIFKPVAFGEVTKKHFKAALNNLEKHYIAVGIEEQLNDFAEYLIFKGIIKNNNLKRVRVTSKRTKISQADKEAIEKYNKWDLELFGIIQRKWQ